MKKNLATLNKELHTIGRTITQLKKDFLQLKKISVAQREKNTADLIRSKIKGKK